MTLTLKIALPKRFTPWEVSKYDVFSGPYFPVFGLNLRIHSEYRKIRTEKTPYLDTFTQCLSNYYQKQLPEVFCEKRFLKIFANFTVKHLCWCLFLMKVFFCKICETFKEHLFWRTSANDFLFITMENLISKSKI